MKETAWSNRLPLVCKVQLPYNAYQVNDHTVANGRSCHQNSTSLRWQTCRELSLGSTCLVLDFAHVDLPPYCPGPIDGTLSMVCFLAYVSSCFQQYNLEGYFISPCRLRIWIMAGASRKRNRGCSNATARPFRMTCKASMERESKQTS